MEFDTQTSKVYIQTDEAGRILRCEGGYTTPADLTGWIKIDEGMGDKYNLCQNHYFDSLYTDDGIPRYRWDGAQAVLRTEEELEVDRLPGITAQARAKRDKLLEATDWTQVMDAPIDEATMTAYRVYRQALRDVPQQEGFPDTIIWPECPKKVKTHE